VVQDVNESSVEHKFHHSTLYPFTGTLQEAKELARIDRQEYRLQKVLSVVGNTADRETLRVNVSYTDGTISDIPYHVAAHTQVFADFCTGVLYGRELSMTRQELAQWKSENALQAGQTVMMKMQDWPPPERLHVGDRLFISAHVWNSSTWHIYQRGILPATLRNREPLLLAVVEKITAKRVDISIPHLHLHRGASMIMYKKPMTIQNIKLWTCREHDLHESTQVALGVQELDACTLREELQRAAGMIR
jgi:hypothetical protein